MGPQAGDLSWEPHEGRDRAQPRCLLSTHLDPAPRGKLPRRGGCVLRSPRARDAPSDGRRLCASAHR